MFFPPESDPELVAWVMEQVFLADSTATTALMADLVALDETELLQKAGVPVRSINAAPYGDMMLAGAWGLVEGVRLLTEE
jgi:hypothetical protein